MNIDNEEFKGTFITKGHTDSLIPILSYHLQVHNYLSHHWILQGLVILCVGAVHVYVCLFVHVSMSVLVLPVSKTTMNFILL